jgi:DNA-binding transcriptional LysR family regulator
MRDRRQIMTLNQLQYFYQAAKTQHFNHAAENLSISQPSLSRAISALENELVVMLFERVGRNVTLTKAGQIFLEHTEKILDDIAIAERKMHQLACSGGEISIAYVSPLSTMFIPQAVKAFVSKEGNEGITFNFYQDISSQNIVGLKNGKYDIIFGAKDVNEISIRFIPLMKQEMVVIMPKGHELEQQTYINASTLNKHEALPHSIHRQVRRDAMHVVSHGIELPPNDFLRHDDFGPVIDVQEMAQSACVVGMAMREEQVVNRAQVDAQRLRILNEHFRRSGVEKQSAPTGFDIHR